MTTKGESATSDFAPDRLLLLQQLGLPNPFKTWRYPESLPVSRVRFLSASDELLAVELGDEWRGYPLRLIAAHHIVQDRVGDREVLVTF